MDIWVYNLSFCTYTFDIIHDFRHLSGLGIYLTQTDRLQYMCYLYTLYIHWLHTLHIVYSPLIAIYGPPSKKVIVTFWETMSSSPHCGLVGEPDEGGTMPVDAVQKI